MRPEVVYLGLFSTIFNWVFDQILSPIVKFISSLLEKVLGWLFDNVLEPLLVSVLYPLFRSLLDLVMEILGQVFYGLLAELLKIIDAMQEAFNIFAGIQEVTYDNRLTAPLLEILFRMNAVQRAVLVITAIGFALTMMCAILAVVRSTLDMEQENRHPVSKVLASTFKAMIKMLLIPMVSLFAIAMAGTILSSVNYVMGGNETTLSRIVFVTASLDAAKESKYNVSSATDIQPGIDDELRNPYYTGEKDYADKDTVGKDFDFGKFDYLMGFSGCIFLAVVLFIGMLTFINRIFEVLLLFIVAPFFASLQPLDDGEKFKAWQDMFVGKLFGGYGLVIAMQLYMILVPTIMGGTISFGEGSTEANYLLKFIFLLGGAWATIKTGPVITQLLSFQAGVQEADTARAGVGFAMGAAALAGSAVSSAGGAIANKWRGHKAAKAESRQASDQRIRNRLQGLPANAGAGGSGGSAGLPGGLSGSGGVTGRSGQPMISGKGAMKIGGEGTKGGTRATGVKQTSSFLGGRVSLHKTAEGKTAVGVNFGSALRVGYDKQGNFRVNVLGMGYKRSADGQQKWSLPVVRLKKAQNADGTSSYRVSKVKLPAGFQWKRAETVTKNADGTYSHTMGNMYCSDIKAVGIKRRFDSDTGKVEKLSEGGFHWAKNSEGKYVLTHSDNLLGGRTEYETDADGNARPVSYEGNLFHMQYEQDRKGHSRLSSLKTSGGSSLFERTDPQTYEGHGAAFTAGNGGGGGSGGDTGGGSGGTGGGSGGDTGGGSGGDTGGGSGGGGTDTGGPPPADVPQAEKVANDRQQTPLTDHTPIRETDRGNHQEFSGHDAAQQGGGVISGNPGGAPPVVEAPQAEEPGGQTYVDPPVADAPPEGILDGAPPAENVQPQRVGKPRTTNQRAQAASDRTLASALGQDGGDHSHKSGRTENPAQ